MDKITWNTFDKKPTNKEARDFFKALSSDERLNAVDIINKHNELCVKDVSEILFMCQNTACHHLKILKNAGILNSRRDGHYVFYSINKDSVKSNFSKMQSIIFGGS